jgi:hypothetical protein
MGGTSVTGTGGTSGSGSGTGGCVADGGMSGRASYRRGDGRHG